jgi:hypothetical protein
MASADFCMSLPAPFDAGSTEVALGTHADLPGYVEDFHLQIVFPATTAVPTASCLAHPKKRAPKPWGSPDKKFSVRINYFFAVFLAAFFLTVGFIAAFFFGAGFFTAGFTFFTAAFFFDDAVTAFFLEATCPLFIIGSSQQIISAAQPHSSSTITASPHTSQLNKSPAFTLAISYPPRH